MIGGSIRTSGAALVGALLAVVAAAQPVGDEQVLLDILNAERDQLSLPALQWDDRLAELARDHARDALRAGIASGQSSLDGADFAQRLVRADLPVDAFGENVTVGGDVLEAHVKVLETPVHWSNVLDPTLTHVGIGVAPAPDGWLFVVEDFASLPLPPSASDAEDAIRGALSRMGRGRWRGPVESETLARRAAFLAQRMSELGGQDPPQGRGSADGALYYTTTDPRWLPQAVRDLTPHAREYGVAVALHFAPPDGAPTYDVVVLLHGMD